MSSKDQFRKEMHQVAKQRGWDIKYSGGGHFKLTRGKNTVVASSSPRNPSMSLANTIARMKRYENDTGGVQQH